MAKDFIGRYVWIIDTIRRYGRISREELRKLWLKSPYSNGTELPERTFYHYRRAIEENFHIDIGCTASGEYYIEESASKHDRDLTDWLVDTSAVRKALTESADIADRVSMEQVPSAREFLPLALEAIRERRRVSFTYAGFSRSRPQPGIEFCPYFVKLYRQRWYMIGQKADAGEIRTYALDRVKEMHLLASSYDLPAAGETEKLFANLIGISSSKAPVRRVVIRTTPERAKYLRALPLHDTQRESIHDRFSLFSYRLQLNYELVHEIMSWGSDATVMEPVELKAMVTTELRRALAAYDEK